MSREPASTLAEVRRDVAVSVHALVSSFRNRDLARAQLALLAFSICEWASFIALMVYAYADGGAAMIGLISLVQLIPAAIVAPLGSVLGDRYRRERVYLLAESALAASAALTAVAALLEAPAILVYTAGCSVGWILTLVRPTHGALLPWLARDPTELTSAYTGSGLIESVCVFLGPLVATAGFAVGTSLGASGPGLVYAALAVLLGLGAVLLAGIRTRTVPDERDAAASDVLAEVGAGFGYLRADPRPRVLVTLLGLATLVLGFVDTLIVILAFDLLGGGGTGVGALNAALGIGGVLGATVAIVAGGGDRLFPAFRAGAVGYGAPLALIGAAPVTAPVLLAASGAGWTMFDITGRTMLQRLIPDEKLTRTLGVLESAYMASEGIGAFASAMLVATIGPRWTLAIAGAVLPVAGFAARTRLRSIDVGVRAPAEDLALLRATSIFEPLPPAALERLARNSVPAQVPSGTVVIREGDPGDRMYVIAEGEADVTSGGRHVARLEPGDHVGEIALLRDVPRTATVTAVTDLRLLGLERDVFLRTVTGHESSHAGAHAVAAERLEQLSERADGSGTEGG